MLDVTGDPDGIPVVLLPAFGLARSMWHGQQESLVALGYRVVSVDLPGLSEVSEADFSMAGARDAIAADLERSVRRPAHLVGISLGATLAAWVALDHPERVASLVP
ncbi:MAG TPA: alpha/beta fold hydrolase [Actinomycetes bacterium]